MENKQIKKPLENLEEYAKWAAWCNENGYIIKDDNPEYYYCVKKPEPVITDEDKLLQLEAETGLNRAMREIILSTGVTGYLLEKTQEIEALAREVRGDK